MRELLASRGVPLIVVVFPIANQVDAQYLDLDREYVLYPQKRIIAICGQLGLPYLDLTAAIQNAGGAELYRDFLHLNGRGNDVVAAELSRYLEGVLRDPPRHHL